MTTEINIKDKQAIIKTLEMIINEVKGHTYSEAYEMYKASLMTIVTLLKETK